MSHVEHFSKETMRHVKAYGHPVSSYQLGGAAVKGGQMQPKRQEAEIWPCIYPLRRPGVALN